MSVAQTSVSDFVQWGALGVLMFVLVALWLFGKWYVTKVLEPREKQRLELERREMASREADREKSAQYMEQISRAADAMAASSQEMMTLLHDHTRKLNYLCQEECEDGNC